MLFDQVLQRRIDDGTWNRVLAGDVVKTHDRGALFESEEAEADNARALRGEVSATGPIFGARMRWPSGAPGDLERDVLSAALGSVDALDPWAKLGAGSRRALRVLPEDVDVSVEPDSNNNGTVLALRFRLPKGAYATTVLASICEPRDASNAASDASRGSEDSSSHDEFGRDTSPSSR
jgi:tRNA pseudouridine13 synthase